MSDDVHLVQGTAFVWDKKYYGLCGRLVLAPVSGVATAKVSFMTVASYRNGHPATPRFCPRCEKLASQL